MVCIRVPPLRERREDIPLLIAHYLDNFCRGYAGPVIAAADLPLPVAAGLGDTRDDLVLVRELMPLREAAAALERKLLRLAMSSGGSVRQAARTLGVDHATFLRKHLEWTLSRIVRWAETAGPHTAQPAGSLPLFAFLLDGLDLLGQLGPAVQCLAQVGPRPLVLHR